MNNLATQIVRKSKIKISSSKRLGNPDEQTRILHQILQESETVKEGKVK